MNIIQITDTHITADPAETFDGVDTSASLQQVLLAINDLERQPDLVLLTGDLVHHPEPAAYQRLLGLLKVLKGPIYAIPGNHDNPDLMRQELTVPVYHDKCIERNSWRILLLNSWLADEHAGHLPETELRWLENELNRDPEISTLIALHHPPVSIDSPWMDAMGLRNASDFLAITDQYSNIRGIIWGHIHQVFESERKGVKLLACPSTCIQFKPHSKVYAKDILGPGYRWLKLLPGGVLRTGVDRAGMQ